MHRAALATLCRANYGAGAFALLLAAMPALALACGDHEPAEFTVRAALLDVDAPVSVEATALRDRGDGRLYHDVRITWNGTEGVLLDDVRFTHHVKSGGGHLVTSGRGCGIWGRAKSGNASHICTADFAGAHIAPGETHAYPVVVHLEAEQLRLDRSGTYSYTQVIRWWLGVPRDSRMPGGEPGGRFTIRLTYGPD